MRKFKLLPSIIFLLLSSLLFSQHSMICLTIDDLPVVSYGLDSDEYDSIVTSKIIQACVNKKVPAIGFVLSQQLYTNDTLNAKKIKLLEQWLDAGLDLGNHTFSHPDINHTPLDKYFLDILQAEKGLKEIMKKHGHDLKYFRHPYLHTGNTKEKSDSLEVFLKEHHYEASPVTIDNDDYLFAKVYHNAYLKKDSILMKKIGKEYVDYMVKKLIFFDKKGLELVSFADNKQTLLIHASMLNADYLPELISQYESNGYQFYSQEVILQDTILTSNTVYPTKGLSWIYRKAFTMGKDQSFKIGDPEVSTFILDLAKNQ